MAKARRAKPTVKFNGKNVNESIAPYLKSIGDGPNWKFWKANHI